MRLSRASILSEGLAAQAVAHHGESPVPSRSSWSGLVIGLPCAFVAARLLSALLFGIGSHDAATFAGASGILLLVALAACAIPAIRASRINPLAALRID